MKKKLLVLLAALTLTTTGLVGCNKQIIDTTYKYDYAIIMLPTGEIVEGDIQSWTDYSDGDQIQVKISGISYLVHSEDIVLIAR